ncbi:MAG: hypothetical protein H7Y38_14570 [Armatimonadetes bacterium]|nr:hypothetical protein [Armatimonadota bacterium]
MEATTDRYKPHPAYRAGSILVAFLILFHAVFAPSGDHWFDENGSFCQAAEVNRCPVANGMPDNPAYNTACSDFVADEGCTDCYSVSSSVRPAETDTASAPLWATVLLSKPTAIVFAAISSTSVSLCYARPPPNGFRPPPLSVRCPRPPPAS